MTRLMMAMISRNVPGHGGADQAGVVVQVRVVVLDRTDERLDAEREQERQREHDRRVAEGEPEPDRHRALAVVHELAGGVVDGGDVVAVEGVPHAQGVGGEADAEAEGLGAEAVVMRRDQEGDDAPADHVQADDDRGHPAELDPLGAGEAAAKLRQPLGEGEFLALDAHARYPLERRPA